MKLPPLTLRTRLLSLVLVALVPLVAFFLYTRSQVRDMASQEWRDEVARLASEAAHEHVEVLEESRQLLEVLARIPAIRSMDATACREIIAPVKAQHSYYSAVGLVGPDLYAVCTNPPVAEARLAELQEGQDARLYLGDRGYIQRAVRSRRFAISRYHRGRLSRGGSVSLAHPILGPDSTVLGVLAVGVQVPVYHRSLVSTPQGASVTIFDRGGTIILREPGEGGWPGRVLPDTLRRTLIAAGTGPVEGPGLEGTNRLLSTAAIRFDEVSEPLGYLTLGLDPERISGSASGALRADLLAVGIAGLLLMAGIWGTVEMAFLRRLSPVVRASERLGRGDLDARTGIDYGRDEIGQLARTFDRMAGNLQDLQQEEKRRARKEIIRREERFRQLVQAIDEVFWIFDADTGTTVYASPTFEKIWGRPASAVLDGPDSWLACIHPDDREAERRARPLTRTERVEREYRIVRPDGEVRWILDRSFPLPDPDGETHRVAGLAKDITEHRELEAALQRSQKLEALGRLAGGVAHDFNNLLTAIRGHTQLLLSDLDDAPEIREDIREIDDAARRAGTLTGQLLAFSRKQALKPVSVCLNRTVEEMERLLARLIDEDVELVSRLAPDLDQVRADPASLEQIVMNLVVNARDAMPEGGRLVVETDVVEVDPETALRNGEEAEPGRYVRLTVTDTGTGMTPEVQARIFDPFFTTKDAGGTGLGLATVYGTVHQSGGFVTVESGEGEGSRFRVYLPSIGPARKNPGSSEDPPAPEKGQETILVVEDEDAVRAVARRALTRYGYTVIEAEDGRAGLEAFSRHEDEIDMVLTDVVMPRLNGPGMVEELRTLRPDLRVLYMSGYPGDGSKGGAALNPDENFLPKPFSATGLAQAVRDVLDTPE